MNEMFFPIFRTMTSFIVLIIITIIAGKHINSHKNYYSFAFSITIGSLVANMGFNTKINFLEMLLSLVTLVLLFYLFLLLSSKSRWIGRWLAGKPTVLIEKGKVLDENMQKIRLSLDDLSQRLRELGVFDINEVDFALLEASGQLSILKKCAFQTVNKNDLQLPCSSASLPIELIMGGKIMTENLTASYDKDWIQAECRKRGLKIEEVYYAVINSNGSLFMDLFHDGYHSTSD